MNIHHWHWHLVYPGEGPVNIVNKDRRGELFYYMHNQTVIRYNVDRMCSSLERVKPLNNLRAFIPEAYFPKIVRSSNNRSYPARVANSFLQDVNRTEVVVTMAEMERCQNRIYQAIDQGYAIGANGQQIPLNGPNGIDILANIVESSSLSPNRDFYGNLHSDGHNIIAYVHDPQQRYLEEFGVMGDFQTAMRDPVFYVSVKATQKPLKNVYNVLCFRDGTATLTQFSKDTKIVYDPMCQTLKLLTMELL